MSSRLDVGRLLDVNIPTAFAVISGAISGVVPKVSTWIKLRGVASMQFALSTTGTVNGTWTADVATNSQGRDAKALPNPPTFPTGVASSGTVTVAMPGDAFQFLRLTFTPSAGAGNANANAGKYVSQPVSISRTRQLGMFFFVPATDTLAGTHLLEYSPNFDGALLAGSPKPIPVLNNSEDPALWFPAIDAANSAIALASPAGSGQSLGLRLGTFEFVGIRHSFTPTAGFGSQRVYFNSKG